MKNQAAVALGRLGGAKRSKAKTAAARANGKKGGARPKGLGGLRRAYRLLMASFLSPSVPAGEEVEDVLAWLHGATSANDLETAASARRWLERWAPDRLR